MIPLIRCTVLQLFAKFCNDLILQLRWLFLGGFFLPTNILTVTPVSYARPNLGTRYSVVDMLVDLCVFLHLLIAVVLRGLFCVLICIIQFLNSNPACGRCARLPSQFTRIVSLIKTSPYYPLSYDWKFDVFLGLLPLFIKKIPTRKSTIFSARKVALNTN